MISIAQLKKGQAGRIICLKGSEFTASRFMDMGLYAGDQVQLIDKLFFGKNLVLLTKDGKYVIRTVDAQCIKIKILPDSSSEVL